MWSDYRKRPVVVQAVRLTEDNIREVGQQVGAHRIRRTENINDVIGIAIKTLEGTMHAYVGEYVIRGVQGEFYPVKSDIFEQTYEPARSDDEDSTS